MIKVLGIETSFGPGRLALLEGDRPAGEGELAPGLRHSAGIVPLLEQLLGKAGWRPADLGLVAVGLGPGSFTGLRVGAALGQGLAFALGLPLFGVCSFEAMAASLPPGIEEVSLVSDARRCRAYAARYRRSHEGLEEIAPPEIVPFDKLSFFTAASAVFTPFPGTLEFRAGLAWKPISPSPLAVARLAAARFRAGEKGEPSELRPLYLGGHYRIQGGKPGAP